MCQLKVTHNFSAVKSTKKSDNGNIFNGYIMVEIIFLENVVDFKKCCIFAAQNFKRKLKPK